MNYLQVVDWLFSQLANYHKQGSTAYKPGLDNISNLLAKLEHPQSKFKSIHIAGTNGKGSTANMVAAMAIENGYKVGLFTSPHIKDFRERIRINGQMIEESFVVDFVNTNKAVFEALDPSFFEITTAMAFVAFAENGCDYAVIETGLGGRLDATNILNPEISVITNIGIDHTEFLGNTLKQIASEKAGIIKKNAPVVIGEILEDTKSIFDLKTELEETTIYHPKHRTFSLDLLGAYQQKNAALAWETIQVLKEKGHYFDDRKSTVALTRVQSLTNFTGRLAKISNSPNVIIDASHNPAGIKTLFEELKSIDYNKLHCIYGTSADKDYAESMTFFPKDAAYYFTSFDSSRAVKVDVLAQLGVKLGLNNSTFTSPELALADAKIKANSDDLIIVFGSFYILEKII